MNLANEVQRLCQQYGLTLRENPYTTVSPSVSILITYAYAGIQLT